MKKKDMIFNICEGAGIGDPCDWMRVFPSGFCYCTLYDRPITLGVLRECWEDRRSEILICNNCGYGRHISDYEGLCCTECGGSLREADSFEEEFLS